MKEQKIVALFGIGGLGKSVCERLIQDGYKLILFDIKNEEDELLKEIIKNNDQVMEYYKTDIKDIEKVRKNIEKAYSDFGPIDAMVYTSGITRGVLFENIEEKDWDIVFDINLKGAFFRYRLFQSL